MEGKTRERNGDLIHLFGEKRPRPVPNPGVGDFETEVIELEIPRYLLIRTADDTFLLIDLRLPNKDGMGFRHECFLCWEDIVPFSSEEVFWRSRPSEEIILYQGQKSLLSRRGLVVRERSGITDGDLSDMPIIWDYRELVS